MIGNSEWNETPIWHDDYKSEEEMELSPLDEDYVREEYRGDSDE